MTTPTPPAVCRGVDGRLPTVQTIVDRATWMTPSNWESGWKSGSCLYNEPGYKCCLGFRLEVAGIEPKDMTLVAMPADLVDEGRNPKLAEKVVGAGLVVKVGPEYGGGEDDYINTSFSSRAETVNDDKFLEPFQRERTLQMIWVENGEEITFVGRFPHE